MTPFGDPEVIIVGSGPAGVSVAWPLVEAGVHVLMLDAGEASLPLAPTPADRRGDPLRWQAELGRAGPIATGNASPKFATPLAAATLAGFGEAIGLDTRGFAGVGSLAVGGLSNIWGALATRYGADELTRFPGGGVELEASYARVAARIGIGGGNSVDAAPTGSLTPPLARIAGSHVRRSDGLDLVTAPNAVLVGEKREGRGGCNRCGACLYGCARGSIYRAGDELPALRRRTNFAYRGGVFVERLSGGPGMHVVHARTSAGAITFRAPAVVLAAGTLATTSLAVRRMGLAGRRLRLESNPVGGIAFVVPQLIGRALPARSFGLGQLFYTLQVSKGVEAAGVLYGADTLPLAAVADRLPFTRVHALAVARALAPALILATGYLPGAFGDNRLTVEEDGHAGRVRIDGGATDAAAPTLTAAFAMLTRALRRRGAWAVPGSRRLLPPGADAHPAATLPMGGHGPAATEIDGGVRGLPGLYVADGAALPFLSARHPTLTIMANADRIGRTLARRIAATPALRHVG